MNVFGFFFFLISIFQFEYPIVVQKYGWNDVLSFISLTKTGNTTEHS